MYYLCMNNSYKTFLSRYRIFLMAPLPTIFSAICRVVFILLCSYVLSSFPTSARSSYSVMADSVLKVLDKEIENRSAHRMNKERGLIQLKNSLSRASANSTRFELCGDIYEEYSRYQSDSAFSYARKSYDVACMMADSSAINRSYMMLMECFYSVGLLKESADLKNMIDTSYLSAADRLNYYRQMGALYTNLNSFLGKTSHIRQYYDERRDLFTEKAIGACADDPTLYAIMSLEHRTITGIPTSEELERRRNLIQHYDLPLHELAKQYCAMGKACIALDDIDAAIYYSAMSAICDQRICNNETMSTYILADLMHRKGDIDRASRYINAALDEANFFNSRLRKIEINAILPDIVDSRWSTSQSQKHALIVIACVVLALLVWVLVLWLKVRKRNHMLSIAQNESRQQTELLNIANERLIAINGKLEEADEIKNRCIMESLYANQSFVDFVDKTGKTIERKMKTRQYDDISDLLRSIGVKNESRRILSTFDSIFLSIFPAFVEHFNSLLDCGGQLTLNEDGSMSTELRIFALMRLGISDTGMVSKYLNISPNTIYVYKARVKSHSIVDKDEFDSAVMKIAR